jgi:hypothetical protein
VTYGPVKPKTQRMGGKAFYRWPRITVLFDMPEGVRITANPHFHNLQHEYLQADGRWLVCAGRSFCKMCNREEAMKTTKQRLREALSEHFGMAHLAAADDDTGLFGPRPDGVGRALGDDQDRIEMLIAVENEFQIELPQDLTHENPTIAYLAGVVDDLVAANRA